MPFFSKKNKEPSSQTSTNSTSALIQPKLAINKPGGKYEQEADAVADQVVPQNSISTISNSPLPVQRFAWDRAAVGSVIGAAGGALVGAGVGALVGNASSSISSGAGATWGALVGGGAGLLAGGLIGGLTGGSAKQNPQYKPWYQAQIKKYGNEGSFPLHIGLMNVFYKVGREDVIKIIIDHGYTIKTFEKAFDKWEHPDGSETVTDLSKRLNGNTQKSSKTIRLNKGLPVQNAAMTLFHELMHVVSTETDYLEQEIEVRIKSEQFAIDSGFPPTRSNYRKKDGTVDKDEIRKEIMGSSHYNPSGKKRIDRWYEGEKTIGPWALP